MKIVLISTYELGHQPFGLASPAAWLRRGGHDVVCLDLSRDALEETSLRQAQLIALYVPMHTATRLCLELVPSLRRVNPAAHLCAYGLYAAIAAESFRAVGVEDVFSGEFEPSLVNLAARLADSAAAPLPDSGISVARLDFVTPDRAGLPALRDYAKLILPTGEQRVAGYTESSRGCKHLCRHCPIVPVYDGVFRVVARNVVLDDIRQQVAAGARHITFGDPDFFNGPGHAIPLVEALHAEFPDLTYDATIKVEHLRKHAALLPVLRSTGCLFIISAVESLDAETLRILDKNHSREDFFEVVELCRRAGIALQPTFLPFTPWTSLEQILDLFVQLRRLGLVSAVAPIQLAIRLLIPPGSRLLELAEVRALVQPFDAKALVYPWQNPDPAVDRLAAEFQEIVGAGEKRNLSRAEIFDQLDRAAHRAAGRPAPPLLPVFPSPPSVPYINEPWYCCAEPSCDQFVSIGKSREALRQAETFL